MERRLLSEKEAAEFLGISPYSLGVLRRRGAVSFVKPNGVRRFFYTVQGLNAALEAWAQPVTGSQIQGQPEAGKIRAIR